MHRLGPHETDAPLIVNANAIPACAITLELFETIARGNAQVIKRFRSIENHKLPQRGSLNVLRKSLDATTSKDVCRLPATEAPNHTDYVNATR